MTMPDTLPPSDGIQAQILLELGKLSTQVAVFDAKLDHIAAGIADHEARLRALENTAAQSAGGRDLWARVIAGLSAAVAAGSGAAVYLHK